MSFATTTNAPFGNRPTGELGIMNGMGDPIPYATLPSQQVNVGDILVQGDDTTYSFVALPAAAVPAGATAASASAAALLTLQKIHGANLEAGTDSGGTVYGFLGLALDYKDPNNTSTPALGGSANRIGIAPSGRAKMRVVPGDANFTNALPAGTLIGAAVNAMSTNTGPNYIATPIPGYVQTSQCCASATNVGGNTYAGTTYAGTTTPLTASEAIGRLAFDKGANDTFVWVDVVSSILSGGVQNTQTTG
jgi:hypothetical protein